MVSFLLICLGVVVAATTSATALPQVTAVGGEEGLPQIGGQWFNGFRSSVAVGSNNQPHAVFDQSPGSFTPWIAFFDKIGGVWQGVKYNETSFTGSGWIWALMADLLAWGL